MKSFMKAFLPFRISPRHNEVGYRIWEASLVLLEHILAHPELFANKSVLELGSGVGHTATLGFLSNRELGFPMKRMVLSDYKAQIVENLNLNLQVLASLISPSPCFMYMCICVCYVF